MALLLVEGFEGFGTGTGAAPQPTGALARQYTVVSEASMDIEAGRIAGYSCEFGSTACFIKTGTLTVDDTLIVGFAMKFSTLDNPIFLVLYDGITAGIQLIMTPAGQVSIYRGGTLLATSATVITIVDTWYYIELKVKCNNTTGTYELRIGDVVILSDTGVDTQIGTNAYHDIVGFTFTFGSGTITFDDIYICDSTGATGNDFLGNSRVVAITPNGDDTANFDTASGGSSHYLDVDENPADDDTTYVEDGTSGHKDLYDYTAMTANLGVVAGLAVKTVCRETDANPFSLIMPIKSDVTESDDGGQAIGTTSYVTLVRISELDPHTSTAWTKTIIDAAEFGVKVA